MSTTVYIYKYVCVCVLFIKIPVNIKIYDHYYQNKTSIYEPNFTEAQWN